MIHLTLNAPCINYYLYFVSMGFGTKLETIYQELHTDLKLMLTILNPFSSKLHRNDRPEAYKHT